MNWREHPYLFIGFNVFSKSTNSSFVFRGKDMDEGLHKRDGIKLIARPISDMTDEEICNLTGANHTSEVCDSVRNSIIREVNKSDMRTYQFLYLRSIGVYPFPWDETIIETTGGE